MAKDLPPRENALFKRIIKCYENKQYKTGLKHARQILSNTKFHEHGETLAMMGLTLNCLGRKEEAYDNVKRGLRNNLQSHVCWHVFGLLQRSDKKYEEAIKCYRNALRWDKDNLQILRDLSLLQIQTRDLDGYKMTRHQLLMLRANQRAGWIGYAISLHILGEYENALNVLATFRKTQEVNKGKPTDYEYSELLLYEANIMIEAGKYKEALTHIAHHQDSIMDVQSWLEIMGDLHYRLGHYEDSVDIYERLIHRNPENSEYIEYYIRAHQPQSLDEQIDLCEKFHNLYPKADAPLLFALKLSTGKRFQQVLDRYFQRQLRKGVTPLFNITKHLLKDKNKMAAIENTVLGYYKCLEDSKKFTPDSDDTEFPTSYLHVMIYLAQLYDYKSNLKLALHYIDRAIMHTPTYIDPYTIKSKIYKHAGNLSEAVTWMDKARTLDLADRYLNSKCAKYMLHAGMLDKAEETCSFFTREGQPAVDNLNEMQCMWFLTESANAYFNKQDWANTLKKCHEVEKHFVDIVEDQFDFHPYSMRKMTLRAYIGLLRLEDKIRGQNFYNKAAELALKTYIHLYDKPNEAINGHGDGEKDQISEKERKKMESKKRKAAAKKKQKQESVTAKTDQKNKGGTVQNENENICPPVNGEELMKTEKPLDDAIVFLDHLRNLSPNYAPTHSYAFQIYYRKHKILLMLQSIKRSLHHHPGDPNFLFYIPQFYTFVKTHPVDNVIVRELVKQELDNIVPNDNIEQWIVCQEHQYSHSLPHMFMLGCARVFLKPSLAESELNKILNFDLSNTDLKSCTFVLEHLKSGMLNPSPPDIQTFIACSREMFPQSTALSPPQDTTSHDDVIR